jgi:methyl-accepting chemotaxis protein
MKPVKLNSVQSKITFWAGCCLLLLSVVLILYAVLTQRKTAMNTVKIQAVELARNEASEIETKIEKAMDSARTLAQALSSMKTDNIGLSRNQVNSMLRQVLSQNPDLIGIYTLWEPNAFDGKDAQFANQVGYDETGRFIPYWMWSEGEIFYSPSVNYEDPGVGDYYLIPKNNRREAVIDPYLYPMKGVDVLVTSLVVPIVVDGHFYGIVGVDIPLDFLQKLADGFNAYDGTAQLSLISNNGTFAGVTGQSDSVGKTLSDLRNNDDQYLSEIKGGKEIVDEKNGNIEVYTPIQFGSSSTPWSVNLLIPLSAVYADVNATSWQLVIIGATISLFSLVLLWFLIQQVVNPIKLLTFGADKLSIGDVELEGWDWKAVEKIDRRGDELTGISQAFHALIAYFREMANASKRISRGDLTVKIQPKGENDLLGNALYEMNINLHNLIQQVSENASHLRAASKQLAVASNQAGQATNQIAATVQQVAKGTSQQSSSINQTADSTEQLSRAIDSVAKGAQEQAFAVSKASNITSQMSSTIQQVADNAQSGSQSASQAAATAQSGVQSVQDTILGMQAIKVKVGLSAQKVKEMGIRSQQIGVIVETIEDIASQTNLLALNAAIEAARAGEHGKGFAVVADEVRKLAERSASATKEIATLISGIQATIKESVNAMDDSALEVENGVERASQSGEALNNILLAVENVTQQVDEITSAAQRINTASNEMVVAMDSVSAVVEENTAATEEMTASAEEVAQSIENIAAVSQENSAAIEEVSASAEEMTAQVEEVTAAAQSLAEMAESLQNLIATFKLQDQISVEHDVESATQELYIGVDRRKSYTEDENNLRDNGHKVNNLNN